jgi:hypothetical protein
VQVGILSLLSRIRVGHHCGDAWLGRGPAVGQDRHNEGGGGPDRPLTKEEEDQIDDDCDSEDPRGDEVGVVEIKAHEKGSEATSASSSLTGYCSGGTGHHPVSDKLPFRDGGLAKRRCQSGGLRRTELREMEAPSGALGAGVGRSLRTWVNLKDTRLTRRRGG